MSRPVRKVARTLEPLGPALVALLAALVWLLAAGGGPSGRAAAATSPGLELILSGAANARLELPYDALAGEPCRPGGFRLELTAAQAGSPLTLAFAAEATANGPAHHQLGPGVPALTLSLDTNGSGDPTAFVAQDGSVTVDQGTRLFTAFLVDELGRRLYASGALTCPA